MEGVGVMGTKLIGLIIALTISLIVLLILINMIVSCLHQKENGGTLFAIIVLPFFIGALISFLYFLIQILNY